MHTKLNIFINLVKCFHLGRAQAYLSYSQAGCPFKNPYNSVSHSFQGIHFLFFNAKPGDLLCECLLGAHGFSLIVGGEKCRVFPLGAPNVMQYWRILLRSKPIHKVEQGRGEAVAPEYHLST